MSFFLEREEFLEREKVLRNRIIVLYRIIIEKSTFQYMVPGKYYLEADFSDRIYRDEKANILALLKTETEVGFLR